MPTMPLKSCVSSAGVRLQCRTRTSPSVTNASATAVPTPMRVIAMPLEAWYDLPDAAATPASAAASSTPTAWTASTIAAPVTVTGRLAAAGDAAVAVRASGCRLPPARPPPARPSLPARDAGLAWARARAPDREPTCYLHDPATPRRDRVGPGLGRSA